MNPAQDVQPVILLAYLLVGFAIGLWTASIPRLFSSLTHPRPAGTFAERRLDPAPGPPPPGPRPGVPPACVGLDRMEIKDLKDSVCLATGIAGGKPVMVILGHGPDGETRPAVFDALTACALREEIARATKRLQALSICPEAQGGKHES